LPHGERETIADHAGSCDECRAVLGALFDVEPEKVDRYTIAKRIGAGAMGTVYEAHDPELDRKVAIKVLRGAGSAERLRREAQMLAKLHHPNVVAVYDAGEHEGRTFVAMALVDGENLRAWLRVERSVDDIVRVIRDAGRGLAAAHAAGVIHRDLKPDNIFIARDGSVLVGDFGLAFVDGERGDAGGGDGPVELTQTGMVLGTPAYMAPEHAAGEPTAASDQFSLCVTAWEALYGARPFAGATFAEIQQAIEKGELAVGKRAVPARIRAALERGLRAKTEDRWSSLAELDAALAPPRRKWPWMLAAACVLLAGAGAFALATTRGPKCEFSLAELHLGSAAASYEHDWIALRSEVCHTPRSNDARLRCLDRARSALGVLASQMGASDPGAVRDAIESLPQLASCRDALDGDVPPDKLVAGEAQLVKIVETDVRVQLAGGGRVEELQLLDGPVAQLDYEPAVVQLAIDEGAAFSSASRPADAARVLRAGLARAEAAHDDRGIANIIARLAPVSTRMHKYDEAATLLELGDGAYKRGGDDPHTELALESARADLAAATGDHDKAIAIARTALDKVKARPGDTAWEQYLLTFLLVNQLSYAGRLAEATQLSREATRLEGALGLDSHFGVVKIGIQFNEALMQGQADRMLELAQQGVALTEAMDDPHLRYEFASNLAFAYDLAHEPAKAVAEYQHVLEVCGTACTPEQTIDADQGIAANYLELGDAAKAIEPARRAIEAGAAGGKALDDKRWRVATTLARALLASGHPHDARAVIEPVLHEIETEPTAPPIHRAGAELATARALWEDGGDRARARVLAAAAEKDFQAALVVIKDYAAPLQETVRKRLAETIEWRKQH